MLPLGTEGQTWMHCSGAHSVTVSVAFLTLGSELSPEVCRKPNFVLLLFHSSANKITTAQLLPVTAK